jgi:hypothetical protein
MEIPVPLVVCVLVSAFGVQGWILKELIDLKVRVATLTHNQNTQMKRNYKIPLSLMILAVLPLLFLGCATTDSPPSNFGGLLTSESVTNLVGTNEVVSTTYAPNPKVQAGIETARGISAFVPAPYGSIVDYAGLAGVAVLGWIARRKNLKAQKATDTAIAIIRGVEAAAKSDVPPKEAIAREAQLSGVETDLHALVKSTT